MRNMNIAAFNRPAIISDSMTRPADTNAYAAGDVIATSTTAPVAQKLLLAASKLGGYGKIISASLLDSANQATKLEADVFLFTAAVGLDNDNAAFTPTDAEMATLAAVIPLYNKTVDLVPSTDAVLTTVSAAVYDGDATSGAGGNALFVRDDLSKIFKCADASRDLWWVLVARNAYTPVSGEIFTLKLDILQDS